jgi:hypothetical protein
MNQQQLRLDDFFHIQTKSTSIKKEPKVFDTTAGAKILLEPLFIRPVPVEVTKINGVAIRLLN